MTTDEQRRADWQTFQEKTCRRCKQPLKYMGVGRYPAYCSEDCRRAMRAVRYRAKYGSKRP